MSVNVSDLVWTYNSCYKQRCFYNPYPHGSATWTGNGPTGTRNCGGFWWGGGSGGYNYRHELITCSPEFKWCKLLKMVCEWNHEEGRLVKRTATSFYCDADWAALSNAGYIIYDEAAHTWYSTSQGRALNNLIKEAFAELERAKQEAKEKQEETRGTTCCVSGAPESVEKSDYLAPSEKSENMKVKTFTFLISCYGGSADFGPAGCWGKNFTGDELTPSGEIDKTINEFIANKDVISISVQYPAISGHNNGGYNTIMAVYTIIYNN